MINTALHRINEFALLKFYDQLEAKSFFNTKPYSIVNQYVSNNQSNIDNTVWYDGPKKHYVNKIYSNPIYYQPKNPIDISARLCSVFLRQGYNWTPNKLDNGKNIFGICIVLRGVTTGNIYFSGIATIDDFKITGSKELIDGIFWVTEYKFWIPSEITELYETEIVEITYSDIESTGSNIGYIYTYPIELTPIIDSKPLPDFIQVTGNIDNMHYLTLGVITTQNKTVEQSILDYFQTVDSSISISYVVTYGIEGIGWFSTRYSNETNKFQGIRTGLDLSYFGKDVHDITVNITMEIRVDQKLMSRDIILHTQSWDLLNPLAQQQIVHPTTNYPVTVEITQKLENKIINAQKVKQIIPIYQSIFSERISDDIQWENKYIDFPLITFPCYLIITEIKNNKETNNQQIILNEKTEDNRYVFNLGSIVPYGSDSKYKLRRASDDKVIGNGIIKF